MSPYIREEGWFLLSSILLGVGITFLYDCLRICRRVVAHGTLWISLEDLIYWIFVSFCIFNLFYYQNDGAFRWFAILGAALGMLLFRRTVSPFLVKYVSLLLLWIGGLARRGLAFFGKPLRRLGNRAEKTAAGMGRKGKQFARILKKRLTVAQRMAKISLNNRLGKGTVRRGKWLGERSFFGRKRNRTG